MKNALSILLLFTWTLFHYGKIQRYLDCPLTPTLSSKPTVRCDCEKQGLSLPSDNSGSSDANRSVAKPRADDVFAGSIPLTPGGHYVHILPIGAGHLLSSTPAGFIAPIFQPPRG